MKKNLSGIFMNEYNYCPDEYGVTEVPSPTLNDTLAAGENAGQLTLPPEDAGEEYNSITKGKGFANVIKSIAATIVAATILPLAGIVDIKRPQAEEEPSPPPVVEKITEFYGVESDYIVEEDGLFTFTLSFKDENGYYTDFFAALSHRPEYVESNFSLVTIEDGVFPFDLEARQEEWDTSVIDPKDYPVYVSCDFNQDPLSEQSIDTSFFYGQHTDCYLVVGCTSTQGGTAERTVLAAFEITLSYPSAP